MRACRGRRAGKIVVATLHRLACVAAAPQPQAVEPWRQAARDLPGGASWSAGIPVT